MFALVGIASRRDEGDEWDRQDDGNGNRCGECKCDNNNIIIIGGGGGAVVLYLLRPHNRHPPYYNKVFLT
jgi:hypothetical protein